VGLLNLYCVRPRKRQNLKEIGEKGIEENVNKKNTEQTPSRDVAYYFKGPKGLEEGKGA